MERNYGKYFVAKLDDALAALSESEFDELSRLVDKVDASRVSRRKHAMECVVVECDWPEYEQVWSMIERRVDAEAALALVERAEE